MVGIMRLGIINKRHLVVRPDKAEKERGGGREGCREVEEEDTLFTYIYA